MVTESPGLSPVGAVAPPTGDLISGGLLTGSSPGELPKQWHVRTARSCLTPRFAMVARSRGTALLAAGNGSDDCAAWLVIPVTVRRGRTYRLAARFSFSPGLNPHQHLLFAFYTGDFNDGIFRYRRLGNRHAAGEGCFLIPGKGLVEGEVRIGFRLSATGKAWIEAISMEECEPVPARPATVVAMQGEGNGLREWGRVLRVAGRAGADLVLVPEVMNGQVTESLHGPSAQLMSRMAKEFGMYVAGGILHEDRGASRVYNTALLYNRKGQLVGRYRKNHPYSPELNDQGVTPGTEVPVFTTDFGKVGIIICYDGWFGDVTELLALKGAEIVLYPSAGYYRSLIPARAADNCVHVVASSLDRRCPCGIWDSAGRNCTSTMMPFLP